MLLSYPLLCQPLGMGLNSGISSVVSWRRKFTFGKHFTVLLLHEGSYDVRYDKLHWAERNKIRPIWKQRGKVVEYVNIVPRGCLKTANQPKLTSVEQVHKWILQIELIRIHPQPISSFLTKICDKKRYCFVLRFIFCGDYEPLNFRFYRIFF
jgi:hypothetical protein